MMNRTWLRNLPVFILALSSLTRTAPAQNPSSRSPRLSEDRLKSGELTRRSFAPVSKATSESIVQFDLDGKTVALGAVIDANGLALTKASETGPGQLTCKTANGSVATAEVIAVDEENDVGLVKIASGGLKPIKWSSQAVSVGQWAITPGVESVPEAVGIVSVPPRKILHPRSLIGVQLDFDAPTARIREIMPGLGAEKAGLKPGDVVLAVNETPVHKGEELTSTLRQFRQGQTVKLRVQREESQFDVQVQMMLPQSESPQRGLNRQGRANRLAGDLSRRSEGFDLAIQHDTVLQPWQCGGPLVNLDGRAIGLNIARAGRVASYALPAGLVKRIIAELKAQAQASLKLDRARQVSP